MIGHDNTGYVALCGKMFSDHGRGREHERNCMACATEELRMHEEPQPNTCDECGGLAVGYDADNGASLCAAHYRAKGK